MIIPSLNLDAFSILKLSCLILSAIVAIHLYSIPRRTWGSLFGAMALSGCSLFCLAMLLEFAGEHYWQPRNGVSAIVPYLQNLGPSIALTSLILLSFHAVAFLRKHLRIARVAVAISIGLNGVSFLLCVYNFAILRPRSDFSFQGTYFLITYLFLAIQFFFVIFIFLQKASLLSTANLTWSWSGLFKPRNMRARYARTYGLVFILLLLVILVFAVSPWFLPPVEANYAAWVTVFVFLVLFVMTYLNSTRDPVTVPMKLIGYVVTMVLFLLSSVAILVGWVAERDFDDSDLIRAGSSLHFRPNSSSGYDIDETSSLFSMDLGERLEMEPGQTMPVRLDFGFPFFDVRYSLIHVETVPLVYLGESIQENGWGGYHPQPAIAPLIMDLHPRGDEDSGVYVSRGEESTTITWNNLSEYGTSESNTIQLVLHASGEIRISYPELNSTNKRVLASRRVSVHTTAGVAPDRLTSGRLLPFAPRLIGIHPGGTPLLEPLRLNHDLPYASTSPSALFQDFDAEYSRYMHLRMAPLAVIRLTATLFVVATFPVLLRRSITRPLRELRDGMRRAREGDLSVVVPHGYNNDEVGFLIESFNYMLSSIRESEVEARRKQRQLTQADKLSSLGVLVASVAHEINNPNQIILTSSGMIRRSSDDVVALLDQCAGLEQGLLVGGLEMDEFRRTFPRSAEWIQDGSKRIKAIVGNLTDFARAEPTKSMVMTDVNLAIESSVSLLSSYVERYSSRFSVRLSRELPQIMGNQQRIEQVLINLILNACQALPNERCAIELSSSAEAGFVVVSVADEGNGMAPEILDRVREPLFTTKRDRGGTGLGLSVSEGIVREHSGTLEITSEPGLGTTVKLRLPTESEI